MDARPPSRLRNDWMLGICERKRRRAAEDVFELLLEVSAGALYLVEIPVREAIYREGDRGRLGHDLSVLALPPGPAPRVHEIADSVDELAWLERRIGRILSEHDEDIIRTREAKLEKRSSRCSSGVSSAWAPNGTP